MFAKKAVAQLEPKKAALIGPRESKTPGSIPWIIQTTRMASLSLHSLERSTEEWLAVVQELEQYAVWEHYPEEKPYGSREAYFIGEFGKPEPELTRTKVEQQLRAKAGRPKKGTENDGNNIISPRGSNAAYIRARLQRDGHTDMLAKIERNEISAHRAAVELGWRTRTIQHPATVDGFIRAASRHLSPTQRRQLRESL